MGALEHESVTRIRGLCQSLGVDFSFVDSKDVLLEKLRERQKSLLPPAPAPLPPLDANVPEDVEDSRERVRLLLAPYVARGLIVSFPDSRTWHLRADKREDSGGLDVPLEVIARCARDVMG